MPAQFSISEVEDNEEGWGPTSIPDHLAGVPYAPYGKGDKVGKISDFTQAAGKYGGACLLLPRIAFSSASSHHSFTLISLSLIEAFLNCRQVYTVKT